MDRERIVAADKARVWHPYTAMDAYIEKGDPIVVARAEGSHLIDVDGRRYLDGNSSWWAATLGHGHPRLLRALREQSEKLAHCALAGATHEPAALLAEELCAIAPPGLTRVFYTDNGSTSIEVAMKMALQMARQRGFAQKKRFLALDGAFHGETLGATALGGVEVFRRPFAGALLECVHAPFPAPDAFARAFAALGALIREGHETIAAAVVEPMVQGASGMRMYPAEYLRELRALCTRYDVALIVDEVFAGYGRTGPMWASEHAGITPDMMCLGKGFANLLPMGATLMTDAVFDAFRGAKDAALYYGHTFCGHALGAAVAREVLAVYRDEDVLGQVARKAPVIANALQKLEGVPGVVATRALGMIGAVDLARPVEDLATGYLSDLGWRVYDEAKKRGASLRPLGSTVYVCPPLVISDADLGTLLAIFDESVRAALA